ncbi:MAG: ABC transporter ATP-binding protein [Chitinophagales bacterium]|nr:ABC transporter ATP-binding protein [Chitinophagaceae bacterium]MCB9064624.1 ABC transporter ATP-binding protein [Chitinophagales bacterium]
MSDVVINIENVSKMYRLGEVGTGTISHDLNRWWHRVRGKEDPYLKLGEENKRDSSGSGQYVWALKGVSFEVKEGEAIGIIGKNGAGKSTLLKLLSRVTAPTQGIIKAKGRIASLLEVGTGFHPELTGRENIFLNGAILGMTRPEIKKKFDEIVAFSGVARYVDTPVKRYSSGMYVRLAFAVAAYLDPEILIVDEVLAVGDVEFQKRCIGKMKDASQNEGKTVLFVSHNMASIESLTNKAIVLDNGRVDFTGTPRQAIERYFEQLAKNTAMSLAERTDYNGDGSIVFTNAWVEDERQMMVEEVMSGENVYFCVEYEIQGTVDSYDAVEIAMGVYTQNEAIVTDLWNESTGTNLNLKNNKKGVIKCKISRIPLNSGSYYFNIYCKSYSEVRYAIERACSFRVIPGDYFGTGIMLNDDAGVVLVHQEWSTQ